MRLLKRLGRQRWFQQAVGIAAAEYLRFVTKTSRVVFEPANIYDRIDHEIPIILTMWHGQHALTPFVRKSTYPAKVMISRHRDGEINAIAARRLGVHSIRGSGDHGGEFHRKGGVGAFREMLAAIAEGWSVSMTADVPKVSRVAGMGIIKLAQFSGRPIVPVAIATSRRIELNSWDKSVINLPFSRWIAVIGDSILVERDADDDALERARLAVENSLNALTARAYAYVDRTGDAPRG
jgi:hypothetical protein